MAIVTFNNTINPVNKYAGTRTERQQIAIEKWQRNGYKGTLDIIPRFGKTRLGIMAAKIYNNYYPKTSILVVVPNANLVNQWLDEIKAFENEKLSNKMFVITRNVYNDMNTKSFGFIIYDEVHKYLTSIATYSKLTEDMAISSTVGLGLTGTIPSDKYQYNKLNSILPIIDKISESEAIKNNWINKYDEYNLGLIMSHDEKVNYIKYSKFITSTLNLFKGLSKQMNSLKLPNNEYFGFKSDYDVITACLAGAYDINNRMRLKGNIIRDYIAASMGWSNKLNLHEDYDAQIDVYWSPTNIFNRVKTFNEFVRDRNELLNSSLIKLEAVLNIINSDYEIPTIIYTGNVDFAEELVQAINNSIGLDCAIAFHSKITSRPIIDDATGEYFTYKSGAKKGLPKLFGATLLKRKYMEGLNNGKYKVLITVDSLNEGLNVPKLSRVILTAGTLSSSTYKQRKARVLTLDPNNLEKESKVINIYFDDFNYNNELIISRDKTKLLSRQAENEAVPTFIRSTDDLH